MQRRSRNMQGFGKIFDDGINGKRSQLSTTSRTLKTGQPKTSGTGQPRQNS
jgi:hypothetical protein